VVAADDGSTNFFGQVGQFGGPYIANQPLDVESTP
jgi:hypothetical protein